MRITMIGTSHGVPEGNRQCSCALIEVEKKKYLIDVGADVCPELVNRGMTPEQINAIFITHMHGDHTDGLIHFVDLCNWHYLKAEPEIYLPKTEAVDVLKAWIKVIDQKEMSERIHFHKEHVGEIYNDGVLKVTAYRTGHIDVSYGFILEAEGKRVYFTGDLRQGEYPTADYSVIIRENKLDAVIAECAHLSAEEYRQPVMDNPPKAFYFNHYSPNYTESCYRLRSELYDVVPVIMLTDGYEINL